MNSYIVKRAAAEFTCLNLLSSGAWDAAPAAELNFAREESGPHRPATNFRMLYNDRGLFGRFQVSDRYVRCVSDKFQDPVCQDSCVEFFVEPSGGKGYLNFEFSGSGVFLTSHIVDCRRTSDGFADFEMLSAADASDIVAASTLPRHAEEIAAPVTWELGFFIPFTVFERRGFSAPRPGEVWRANFYKCGDKTRYPHWLAWNPVDELNFHLPRCFGELRFA